MSSKYKITKGIIFLISGFILLISAVIPQGTWSLFNDIETKGHTLAVGKCNIVVFSDFDIDNVMPMQVEERILTIANSGSLPVNKVYLHTKLKFTDGTDNKLNPKNGTTAEEFTEQFEVKFRLDDAYVKNEDGSFFKLTLAELEKKPLNIASWLPGGKLNVSEGIDLEIEISFISQSVNKHRNEINNEGQFQDDSLSVDFDIEGICGGGDGDDDKNDDEPKQWDKSSLKFIDQGREGNAIYADVKNGGSGMGGPVKYEVYWVAQGNPKGGEIVATGTVPTLGSGQTYKIMYNPKKSGTYMIKAYQRPGHRGTGELWSGEINFPK
ncbi:TasA family protein [Bacillus sp. V5-8f]|uniref:TasA family protein n=1 Tax=Bacillus sp. V5-8f TaxID=2053044 RepID=UPI0015E13339|nr:TasA family protein [Bacillus sp. V5-8f]